MMLIKESRTQLPSRGNDRLESVGAGGRNRTDTPFGNGILSRARLPIPPHRRRVLPAGGRGGSAHDRPYTGTMPPRVTRFSGEARNTIVAATSSTLGQAAKSAFGMAARLAGV